MFWRPETPNQGVSRVTRSPEALGQDLSFPFLAPNGCQCSLAYGCIIRNSCLCYNIAFSSVSNLQCLSLIGTLVMAFRAHPDNPR